MAVISRSRATSCSFSLLSLATALAFSAASSCKERSHLLSPRCSSSLVSGKCRTGLSNSEDLKVLPCKSHQPPVQHSQAKSLSTSISFCILIWALWPLDATVVPHWASSEAGVRQSRFIFFSGSSHKIWHKAGRKKKTTNTKYQTLNTALPRGMRCGGARGSWHRRFVRTG